ncbi:hypothetical protein ABZP36_010274 [Zizania latifolia]
MSANRGTDSGTLKKSLSYLSAQAASSPARFSAISMVPYALVQCTWDLPSDTCKGFLDALSANASDLFERCIHPSNIAWLDQ